MNRKKVKVAQSCPTLCDPLDYTVHEILQPEYWSRQPFPSPGDLPNPGIEPRSPPLQADSLPAEPTGKLMNSLVTIYHIQSCHLIIDCIFHAVDFTPVTPICDFVIESLYLLISLTYFTHPSSYPSYPWQTPVCSLHLCICFLFVISVHLFFQIPHINESSYFIFLCLTQFTQHSTLQVYPCCCKWQDFIIFMAE